MAWKRAQVESNVQKQKTSVLHALLGPLYPPTKLIRASASMERRKAGLRLVARWATLQLQAIA